MSDELTGKEPLFSSLKEVRIFLLKKKKSNKKIFTEKKIYDSKHRKLSLRKATDPPPRDSWAGNKTSDIKHSYSGWFYLHLPLEKWFMKMKGDFFLKPHHSFDIWNFDTWISVAVSWRICMQAPKMWQKGVATPIQNEFIERCTYFHQSHR